MTSRATFRAASAVALLIGAIACGGTASAAKQAAGQATGPLLQEAAPLAGIEPGGVLRLTDGTALRLAYLRLPDVMTDLPAKSGRSAIEIDAWRERAETALRALLGDGPVRFSPAAPGPDRHGALPVMIRTDGGGLLQEALLSRGLARLDLAALSAPQAEPLREAERLARTRRTGLWTAFPYRVRALDELSQWIGTYQVAIGRVHSAARVRDKFFVNFGAEYDSDVTVLFKGRVARQFRDQVAAGRELSGCPVLVRGWIEFWNGPLVAATEPAQVEPLEECEGEAEQ